MIYPVTLRLPHTLDLALASMAAGQNGLWPPCSYHPLLPMGKMPSSVWMLISHLRDRNPYRACPFAASRGRQQQGMGQCAVGIVQGVFQPGQRRLHWFKLIEKPAARIPIRAHHCHRKISPVGMHPTRKKRWRGRMKILHSSQALLNRSCSCECRDSEEKPPLAKAPERPAMRILGSDLSVMPRVGHEVAKAPIFFIEGIQQKSEIMTLRESKPSRLPAGIFRPWPLPAAPWHYHRCSSHGAIGDGILGMLQDAGIIGKGFQVIEFDLRSSKFVMALMFST